LRKNLISGLVILLPLVISLVIIVFVLDVLTAPFLNYMENIIHFFAESYSIDLSQHDTLLVLVSRAIILLLLFVFVIILGFLGQKLFFNWLVKITHRIMIRIPLIGTIYRMCKDMVTAILADKKKLVSRVVIIPFPNVESRAIGLVMGNAPQAAQRHDISKNPSETLKAVFVATSPHPLSGFVLLTEEKRLASLDISLEDTFKFLISCGVFTPENKKEAIDKNNLENNPPADP